MPFLRATRRQADERLLWSRDIRFVHRLAARLPEAHVLELVSGTVLTASAERLTDTVAAEVAASSGVEHLPEYGLVSVDPTLPERDRYLTAMSSAVQVSGLADRIGMAQSTQIIQTKMLDYFFSLRKLHHVAFQPIVELATGDLHEYECVFRPNMPMLPQSIASIVQAGIDTDRGVELDTYLVTTILARIGELEAAAAAAGRPARRFAINVLPGTLLEPRFDAASLADQVRSAGLEPRQITVECTEQQTVDDLDRLRRHVRSLRRVGFGMAIDDAGAGYASFALIAALRPSVIKIDRDIVRGIGHDTAKQALVDAFVSFSRRIDARLVAEGIERRVDLAVLTRLGVDLGQGYLLGKPAAEPAPPRRLAIRADPAVEPPRVPSRA
jgi:EAL domain-containing protein (putative c-di-GMP-specific phosphodiesterase class I)